MGADDPTSSSRPPIWAGHIGPHAVPDLDAAIEFYVALGGRLATNLPHLASIELRGGTHLVLRPAEGPVEPAMAAWDLMVEDLPATRERLLAAGLEPSEIEASGNHQRILLVDPAGATVRIHSSHVVGTV